MDPPAASALPNQIASGYSQSGHSQLPSEAIESIYTTPIQELHFKEVVERFSNMVINDGDDPIEVWRSLQMFYYQILSREIKSADQGYTPLVMNRERLKMIVIKSKVILEFPALGLTNFDGFEFLYHEKTTSSHGNSNQIAKICLNHSVLKDVVYQEIPNIYFNQRLTKLIENIESESLKMDGLTLEKSSETLQTFLNIFDESITANVLTEEGIAIWFSNMIIGPVVRLLNIVVGSRLRVVIEAKVREVLNISYYHKEGGHGNLLSLNHDKFYTYPDRTLVLKNLETNSKINVMNVEMKIYNCIKPFTDRHGELYDAMFLQVLSQIISGNFAVSALSDGYNVLLFKLNLKSKDLTTYISNADGFGFIPFEYKMVNIQWGIQGFPDAKKALVAMLDEEVELLKDNDYEVLKKNRIELLKDRCLKSTEQLIESFKTWTQTYFKESLNFESHKIAYESNSRRYTHIDIYSNGPEHQPQMLILTKKLCEEMFGVKINGSWNKKMLLKIFDPSRCQIQNCVPELHRSKIWETKIDFESMFDQEVEAYDAIKHFNHRSNAKINTPERYAIGKITLEITNLSYYAGRYILYDLISGRPTRKSHYRQGIQQLQLLGEAKIVPNYIEPSNVYYEKRKFYISDLCHSTLGDYASQSSNYELNLRELKSREKKASF